MKTRVMLLLIPVVAASLILAARATSAPVLNCRAWYDKAVLAAGEAEQFSTATLIQALATKGLLYAKLAEVCTKF